MCADRDLSSLAGLSAAPDETMLSRADVAALLGCVDRTLRRWEAVGEAPPRSLVAGRPRYRLGSVRQWLAAREAQAA